MKGRNISHNIRKTLDIQDYVEKKNIAAVIISVDFEKAFDRVEHSSLIEAFKYFGFPSNMINWIKLLFNEMVLCTINNGYTSPAFCPTSGIYQGNPIGPYGFIILIELLAMRLRTTKEIQGIKIGNIKHLLSMFADDMNIFLAFDNKSWQATMNILSAFEANTGLKTNYDKTVVYRIGSIKHTNAKFYSSRKLKWTNDSINTLGVYISHDIEDMLEKNFGELIEKAENVLKMWHYQNLSLFGKNLVVNSLVTSLFVYRMQVLPTMPCKYVKTFQKLVLGFIWNQGTSKISYQVLTGLKTQEGAGLVDIHKKDEALKMVWVFTLRKYSQLKNLAYALLENMIGDLIWEVQLAPQDVQIFFDLNNFWTQVLIAWSKVHFEYPVGVEQIKNQIIWYNSHLRIDGAPIWSKKLFDRGIIYLGQLVEKNTFLSFEQFQSRFNIKLPFTMYYGILKAIPENWVETIRKTDPIQVNDQMLFDRLKNSQKLTNCLYILWIDTENLLYYQSCKWENEIPNIKMEVFTNAVVKIPKLTISVKLRSFRCKFLMRAIMTNVKLYAYKIVSTKLCNFCELEEESLIHLFFECQHVQALLRWLSKFLALSQQIKWEEIVLLSLFPNPAHPGNALVLFTKYYIYSSKCQKRKCTIEFLKIYCQSLIEIDAEIARSKNKQKIHQIKWANIKL